MLSFSRWFFPLAILAVFVSTGCNKPEIDPFLDKTFSYNLAKLPEDWPGEEPEELLSEAELAVYEEKGRPDHIRIIYRPDREIVTRTEVDRMFLGNKDERKTLEDFEHTWIYYVPREEVVFHPSGTPEVTPLSDKLAIIYKYGDPQGQKYDSRRGRETWEYYSRGRRFYFSEDRLVNEDRYTPMGNWKR